MIKRSGRFRSNGDVYKCNESYFKNLNDRSCYILGFMIADGHITCPKKHKRNRITFGVSEKDKSILNFIRSEISPISKIRNYEKTKSTYLSISSKNLIHSLNELGFENKKEHLNAVFNNIPDNFKWSLIRGFFDGDGNFYWKIRKRGKYQNIECKVSFCNQNLPFLNCIKNYYGYGSIVDQKTYFYLQSSSFESIKIIYNMMYKNASFFLSRKKEKFESFFMEKTNDSNSITIR